MTDVISYGLQQSEYVSECWFLGPQQHVCKEVMSEDLSPYIQVSFKK